MFIVQVNGNDGVLDELVSIHTDRHYSILSFVETCESRVSNWHKYSPSDIDYILDEGHCKFGTGVVLLINTDGFVSDDEIRDELTKQPNEDMTVTRVVCEGEINLSRGMTVDQILESCGRNLDSANSWDIQGQILFKGSDGEWYTITTESTISIASPEFVNSILEESNDRMSNPVSHDELVQRIADQYGTLSGKEMVEEWNRMFPGMEIAYDGDSLYWLE